MCGSSRTYPLSCVIALGFLLTGFPASAARPPVFEAKTLEGKTYNIKDDLGKGVILIFFWSNCCNSSHKEFPFINALYERFREKGLKAYAINIDDASAGAKVKPSVSKYGYTIPILLDPDGDALRKFNPARIKPYVVIIDREGEIIREFAGYKPGDEKEVERTIEREFAGGN
jgi:peroxiredoxin